MFGARRGCLDEPRAKGRHPVKDDIHPPAPRPAAEPAPIPPLGAARSATRGQRLALAFGGLAALLVSIWLFSPILTPFVLAGCIA